MPTRRLPMWAIVLDVFGTLLVGGGIFFLTFQGEVLSMPVAELRGPGIAMIVIGVMLMAPLVVTILRQADSS